MRRVDEKLTAHGGARRSHVAAAAADPAKPRIDLMVSSLVPLGGAETQLLRVAHGLNARGWRVRVITFSARTELADGLEAAGIEFASLDVESRSSHALRAAVRLRQMFRQKRPDVLITFMFHADLLGRVVGRLAGIPAVVSSVRAANIGPELRYRMLAATDRLADVTTTNSSRVSDDLVRRGVVAPGKVRVIANGIDVSRTPPSPARMRELRAGLEVRDDEFAWLAVGHLAPRKDYPTLLHAAQQLVRRVPGWQLRIVGEGALEGELRGMAAELGLESRVRFLGLRPDAAELVYAADGFVMSSSIEGTPNALIEAMLAGIPSVATDVGGVPELLEDAVCGFLVPPAAPDALAGAMERLMTLSPAERASLAEAARAKVVRLHDLERVVDDWEGLAVEILARKAVAAAAMGRGA